MMVLVLVLVVSGVPELGLSQGALNLRCAPHPLLSAESPFLHASASSPLHSTTVNRQRAGAPCCGYWSTPWPPPSTGTTWSR